MEPIKVLIIEDDSSVSKIHVKFLNRIKNFSLVGVANSISDGKYMLETFQPHLILLDLFFPEGNGMDLLYELRTKHSLIDVILITAAKDLDNLNRALKGGVFDYIIKPVFLERFQESLANYTAYYTKTRNTQNVDQQFVDSIMKNKTDTALEINIKNVPKGIDPITLKEVISIFETCPQGGMTALEAGKKIGLARTSARKYCEYLLSIGKLQIKLEYGTIGRPERKYLSLSC